LSASPGPGDLGLLILQLLAMAAVVDAARRLVDRFAPPLPELERWVAVAVGAGALVVGLVQALGFAGELRPAPLAAGVAAVEAAAVTLSRTRRRVDRAPSRRPPAALLFVALGAAALAPALARGLLSVPTSWDGLTYHLFYPTRYLQQASLQPVPFGQPHDQSALYPADGEAMHAFTMAFVRSDLLVAATMVAWTGIFGLAVAALARREGAGAGSAAAAGALAATLPALLSRAGSSYVEPVLDAALVAAVLFARRAMDEPEASRSLALLAGLAAGLAAGTKYTAVPTVALLGGALALAWAWTRTRRAGAAAGLFAAATAALGGGWYLRNALLVGNPFYPTPWMGLPHLERAGLVWAGTSLADRWRELVSGGTAGDALFGLPPARVPEMTLGPVALVALVLSVAAIGSALRRTRAAARTGGASAALPPLVVPAALAVLVATYVRLPYWDNPGLFRSEVRFAVPAAALALALAFAWLARLGVGDGVTVVAGGLGVVLQAALAGTAAGWLDAARAGIWVAGPLAVAALLTLLGARARRARWRWACGAGALALAALGAFAAWAYREAGREGRWLAAGAVFRPFAEAALAAERAHPGPATVAWATSSHNEFLDLFTGRRLERRVIAVPVHPGPVAAFEYRGGDPRREFDRDFWLREVARARPDLLIVSRWRAWHEIWPPEDDWARAAGWRLAADLPDFRVWAPPALAAQGSRGAYQPAFQARAR
jgi:hypothetical protein